MGVTVLALVARVLLEDAWGASAPFLEFMLAVTIAAAFGGLGPGLFATAASALAAAWLMPPRFELVIEKPTDRADLVVFVVVGICVSLISEHARRALAAQKRAEEALRESLARLADSEERLRFALASAQAGCLDWDGRNDRRVWPEGPHRLHGFDGSVRDISLDTWIDILHPDDRVEVLARIRRLFAQRAENFSAEYRIIHPTLGVRWIHGLGGVSYDAEGAPVRIAGINRDVTEQKRTEHERELLLDSERAARAEAERANRTKDEFLAMISHELRTPLNAILGWTHLLRRPDAAPEHRERCLDIIERNTRLQTQLISDLLDVSRITTGKLHLELSPVEVPLVVEAAIDACRSAAEAKQVTLDGATDEGPMLLRGDPGRMQQVVTNLITNAIKFTPEGGRVSVSLARRGEHAVIAVRDTGQGIAPEFLPHLFERFSQADSSMARHHGGLGLGLSIVEHLVGLHGGEVQASSEGIGRRLRDAVGASPARPRNRCAR